MAQGASITQYFPALPYNFDVPPSPYLIGPLKSIFTVVEARMVQLLADYANLQMMLSVTNAAGNYLDAHGVAYSTPRLPGEPDSAYRTRILEALTTGKLTLAAIGAAATNYLASTVSATGTPPANRVYDLRSNPAACAQDAANGNPILRGDFVVELSYELAADRIWFQDYSYLNYTAFAYDVGTFYNVNVDPQLKLAIGQVQMGGTNAVYKTIVTLT